MTWSRAALRRGSVLLFAVFILCGLLNPVPQSAHARGRRRSSRGAPVPAYNPLQMGSETDPPPAPSPDSTLPVPAKIDTDAIANPPVEPLPVPEGTPPQDVVADATPLLQEGGPNYDVFGVGPDDTAHVALVYPDVVNRETASGNWVDIAKPLKPTDSGWTGTVGDAVIGLPSALGPDAPVVWEVPTGSVSTVLEGAASDPGTINDTFDSVDYPRATPSTDFTYSLTPTGYAQQAIMKSADASSSFVYDLSTDGLTLLQKTDGSIEIDDATGTTVGSIPVPIAYDSSAQARQSVAVPTLTDLGSGAYQLAFTIDPSFLAKAVYPVLVDPDTTVTGALRDGYVDGTNATTKAQSFECSASTFLDTSVLR